MILVNVIFCIGECMKNLTAVYWVKNEARYIPEHIEFHLLQGYDYFIFYDNNSDDKTLEVLRPYIDAGLAEIRYYPEGGVPYGKEYWVMDTVIPEQRGKTKWLHIHAIDEMAFCPHGRNIAEILDEYEKIPECGGVILCWVLFSGNGHMTRQNGLTIDNFTEAFEDPMDHVRTIIRPERTISHNSDNHCFRYIDGYKALDENYTECVGPFNTGKKTHNRLQISHYITMSYEECQIKMNKGSVDRTENENIRRSFSDWYWNFMGAPKKDVPVQHPNGQTITIRTIYQDNQLSLRYSKTIKQNIVNRFNNQPDLLRYINH